MIIKFIINSASHPSFFTIIQPIISYYSGWLSLCLSRCCLIQTWPNKAGKYFRNKKETR